MGVANTIVGLSVIFFSFHILGFNEYLSNAIGYLVGFCLSFTLNARWTFNYSGKTSTAALRFLSVALISYSLNLLTLHLLLTHTQTPVDVAQIIANVSYFLSGFFLSKHFAFNPSRKEQPQ